MTVDAQNPSPQNVDVVVTGNSMPALIAALNYAEVGLTVQVLAGEQQLADDAWVSDSEMFLRACIERIETQSRTLKQHVPDSADEKVDEGEHVRLDDWVDTLRPPSPKLLSVNKEWGAQAEPNVMGIPASPLDERTIALLNWRSASRMYVDRFSPLLTIGKTQTLHDLVLSRLGKQALSVLVEPHVRFAFGCTAAELDVAIFAPGLNETLSRAGSLSAAVLAYQERNVARETLVRPKGGWTQLFSKLARLLELYGVTFSIQTAQHVSSDEDGWQITLDDEYLLRARVVVIDEASTLNQQSTIHISDEPKPVRPARIHASVEIQEPIWLSEHESCLHRADKWAIMASQTDAGKWVAHLRSDRFELSRESSLPSSDEIRELLATINIEPLHDAKVNSEIVSAPFSTMNERHIAEQQEHNRTARVVPVQIVGQSIWGNDLQSAVYAAHESSVTIRRNLLGI